MKTLATASLILAVGAASLWGCKKKPAADTTKPDSPAMSGDKAPQMRPAKQPAMKPSHPAAAYACTADTDCQRTCAQGIVNKAWYAKNGSKLERCKDGCAGPRELTLRCVNKVCTGYTKDGKPDKYCNRHKIQWRKP